MIGALPQKTLALAAVSTDTTALFLGGSDGAALTTNVSVVTVPGGSGLCSP